MQDAIHRKWVFLIKETETVREMRYEKKIMGKEEAAMEMKKQKKLTEGEWGDCVKKESGKEAQEREQ